jgi:hypothetical protein
MGSGNLTSLMERIVQHITLYSKIAIGLIRALHERPLPALKQCATIAAIFLTQVQAPWSAPVRTPRHYRAHVRRRTEAHRPRFATENVCETVQDVIGLIVCVGTGLNTYAAQPWRQRLP